MTRNLVDGVSTTVFLEEDSRLGNKIKRKIRVSSEGFYCSSISTKGASAPDKLPTKGGIQASQHKYQRVHFPDQQDGGVPWEVPSLWGRSTPTGRWDPRASETFTPKGVAKRTDRLGVRFRNPGTHGACRVLQAYRNFEGNFPHAGWSKSPKQKKSNMVNANNPSSRRRAKGQTITRNPRKGCKQKIKK